jgi:hypothetical protein
MAVLPELFRILILLHPKSKPEMNKHMKKLSLLLAHRVVLALQLRAH